MIISSMAYSARAALLPCKVSTLNQHDHLAALHWLLDEIWHSTGTLGRAVPGVGGAGER